jgi:hypothetical protein
VLGIRVAGALRKPAVPLQCSAAPERKFKNTIYACHPELGNSMNRKSGHFAVSAACAVAALLVMTSCATKPIPQARLSKSAFITAGDTNLWLAATGKAVTVVDVDGATPEHNQGPIELSPGTHKVRLKCADNVSEQEVTVAAGEVYQFSVLVDPRDHHVEGRLQRIKPAANGY